MKNNKLWRREGNIMAVRKNITWEQVSNIIFPKILKLFGRISSGEKGKGTEISGKKIKIKNEMGVGKNIKLYGTLYTPAWICIGR